MNRPPLILVSPDIEAKGKEFGDLSTSLSGNYQTTLIEAGSLPLTMPAIAATWIYVFMHAIRDLSTAILLSGADNSIVAVVMLDLWNNGEVPQVAALSIIIAVMMTALGAAFMKLSTRHNYKI